MCRYGKQTMTGMIKDGVSALSRYYLNNFHDGIRQAMFICVHYTFTHLSRCKFTLKGLQYVSYLLQDALDLISGHYNVSRNVPSPFQSNNFEPLTVSQGLIFLFSTYPTSLKANQTTLN